MDSPSEHTLFSDMDIAQSGYSHKTTSTPPSTLELPKPILTSPEDANVEKAREMAFLKLCGSAPRTSELSDALAFLRAVRLRRAPFTSSSSSESSFALPPREPHTAPGFIYNTVSEGRIIEWRRRLESDSQVEAAPNTIIPLSSFLPSCDSSSASSSVSYQDKPWVCPTARVEHRLPYQPSPTRHHDFYSHDQDETTSEADAGEEDMWPYDGRGLYEHHSRRDCGNACFVSCQLRRKFRPRFARFVPWLRRGKLGGKQTMKNSDVPHPPWELGYRSNDDSLEEDHDDGDLEIWLGHVAEKQRPNHELRFELCLDGRPDSRIFSF